jgi:hypothetical protein
MIDLKYYWEQYGLELLAGLSVICILVLYVYNWMTGATGTYNLARATETAKPSLAPTSIPPHLTAMPHTEKDSKLELQSKVILEQIFRRPFYKIRPDFLRNDVTGFNLEIDLYNDDLKLAVEVQGDQHYKFNPFFHRNKEHFMNQRYRDEMKKIKCKANGITLIEVPYRVGEKRLRSFILDQLRNEGFLL